MRPSAPKVQCPKADRCPSSTIARSFSAELEDIFRIDNSVADLDAKLDERCVNPLSPPPKSEHLQQIFVASERPPLHCHTSLHSDPHPPATLIAETLAPNLRDLKAVRSK